MSVDNNLLNKISFHVVYNESILDALSFAKKKGFNGVQVAIETPHLSFESYSEKECLKIREFCKMNNLYVSIHGPDEITSLFSFNSYIKKGIFSYYKDLFAFMEKINSKIITIHLGSLPRFPTDTDPEIELPNIDLSIYEEILNNNLQTLLRIACNKFTICIENYKFNSVILNVLDFYLKKKQVWLCWDLAKTYDTSYSRNNDMEIFFLKNIEFIKQVHLHDINANGKSHKVIGTGCLDFRYYLSKLRLADILDFCIEVRPQEKAYESLMNLKHLISLKSL